MIKTHKKTGQKLLLKRAYKNVSILFVLDEKGNKIIEEYPRGKSYKVCVCSNSNLF